MLSCSPWAFPELANWKIHRISFYLLRKVEKSCLKNDKKSNPLVVLVVPAIMILLKVALVWLSTFFNSVSKSITFLNKYRHAQRKSLYYLDRGSLQIMSACRAPKNVWAWLFLVGNQGNHQNFDPSLLTNKLWLLFMGMAHLQSFTPLHCKGIAYFLSFFAKRRTTLNGFMAWPRKNATHKQVPLDPSLFTFTTTFS